MTLDTYIVEGGVGKCSAFTSLVDKLTEKAGQPIQVYTPYVGCFANNPNVKLAFEQTIPLNDKRIMSSDNIYYSEPYKSNFQFGNQHLIEAYCKLHGIEFESNMVPKMFTDHLKESVDKWLLDNKINDYILIQFSGGQSSWTGGAPNTPYNNANPGRIYPQYLAQTVINTIKQEYPKLTIIDCTLPNEPSYQGTIKCPLHWSQLHELLKNAKGFIGIDSCLQHFAASTKTRGVIVWGSTRWTQFGYTHHKNLQFHMGNKWNENKFDAGDPRNIMVEPGKVYESFKSIIDRPKDKDKIDVKCSSE